MPQHITYVEWVPEHKSTHEGTVTPVHSVKSCAARNPELDVRFECDVMPPDVIRHMVTGETEAQSRSAAHQYASAYVPFGQNHRVHYVGVIAE